MLRPDITLHFNSGPPGPVNATPSATDTVLRSNVDASLGFPAADGDLGSFPGDVISDDLSVKDALTEIEASIAANRLFVRDAANATIAADNADGEILPIAGLLYKVDSAATGADSATNDLGVDGLVPSGVPCPEHFGATGDGVTDDAAAFQACVSFAIAGETGFHGLHGSKYALGDTIWFGNDNASSFIKRSTGNGCTIVPLAGLNNKPVFDLVGIQNGVNFICEGWRYFDLAGTVKPTCFFALARPKQAAGVTSSGNFLIQDNAIFGDFTVGVVRNVQSESNTFRNNFFFNYHESGHCIAMTRHDYFDECVFIEYDAAAGVSVPAGSFVRHYMYVIETLGDTDWAALGAGASPAVGDVFRTKGEGSGTGTATRHFAAGDVITGGGATGKIIRPVNIKGATNGGMWVHVTAGAFADNVAITDASGGSATINMPNGVNVIGPVSTNPTPQGGEFIENNSTASWQDIGSNNFFNVVRNDSMDPPVFISDWIDVKYEANNTNTNNPLNDHLHFQSDDTRNAALGTGCTIHVHRNYMHATHRSSVTFGDPVSGGGSFSNCFIGPNQNTGNVSTVHARIAHVGRDDVLVANMFSSELIAEKFGIDMRGCQSQAMKWEALDNNQASFLADRLTRGTLKYAFEQATNMDISGVSEAEDGLNIEYDNGFYRQPQDNEVTIDAGAIDITRPSHRVDTEANAGADDLHTINVPSGMEVDGMVITLHAVTGTRQVTLKVTGGNIRGDADKTLSNTFSAARLVYRGGTNNWIIL